MKFSNMSSFKDNFIDTHIVRFAIGTVTISLILYIGLIFYLSYIALEYLPTAFFALLCIYGIGFSLEGIGKKLK